MQGAKEPDRDPAIAEFVKGRRKANNLTQQQLAELAGVGKRLIIEIEAGKPTLRMDAVNKVLAVFAKTLGVVDRRDRDEPDQNVEH